ncbi:hypothetical protein [Gracilimonas amylolytica]|uniref:hypothetical protein n=1 Tax=Gracilimonas amylolytica TaxID=1749045 RepID=UPI000CD84001|nr:hypothetical protein [Gracilimonas amylolytica]
MILFVAYGGGHITIVSKLSKYFEERGVTTKILPLTTAVPYCNSHDIEYLRLSEFATKDDFTPKVIKVVEEYVQKLLNDKIGIPYEHTLLYHLIGLQELINRLGYAKALKEFYKHGRYSFEPIGFATSVIKQIRAEAVVTTNSPRMELAFQKASEMLDIPSFAIDDLSGNPIKMMQSSVVFVDNDISRKNLKSNGYKGEIIISGNPIFEEARNKFTKDKSKDKNRLLIILQKGMNKLNHEKTELSEDFFLNFFDEILNNRFLRDFEKITVRFHPTMKPTIYWNSDKFEIDQTADIQNSISKHDFVLGFSSTALYEAYLMGKKVYALSFGKDYFKLPLDYCGRIDRTGNLQIDGNYTVKESNESLKSKEIIFQNIISKIRN